MKGKVREMSVQSDIELLSVQTVEAYASRNGLSVCEAGKIFHRHQIFEKIILQHEYLHQVSFDEVMEYIENVVAETSDELILFHGTIADFDRILLQKSHDRRDFGVGFYTTLLEAQAKEWGYRLSLRQHTNRYYVYQYVFTGLDVLRIKRFYSLDKEWLEFIQANRSKGGLQHDYDAVIGPVADDNTMETIQLYISGILSASEAIERLRYNRVNNQVSFHTQRALRSLSLIRRVAYE